MEAVKVGDRFRSKDPRERERIIEVVMLAPGERAVVENVVHRRDKNVGRQTMVSVRSLRTRWRRVDDE